MIFRKAVKDDFDNIKSLYWELIDQEQGDPSFPHWKKGVHPSDEMLQNRRPQWGQVLERGYKKKKSRAKI